MWRKDGGYVKDDLVMIRGLVMIFLLGVPAGCVRSERSNAATRSTNGAPTPARMEEEVSPPVAPVAVVRTNLLLLKEGMSRSEVFAVLGPAFDPRAGPRFRSVHMESESFPLSPTGYELELIWEEGRGCFIGARIWSPGKKKAIEDLYQERPRGKEWHDRLRTLALSIETYPHNEALQKDSQ
jgi:hypothetical protein